MKTLFVTAAALTAVTFVATFDARASGAAEEADRQAVLAVVGDHLNAVASGDVKRLDRLWHDKATVTELSESGKKVVSVTPIMRAAKKWAKRPDKTMTWKIRSTKVAGKRATVKLQLVWHGTVLDETLTLTRHKSGWRLVAKQFRVVPAPKAQPASSGY